MSTSPRRRHALRGPAAVAGGVVIAAAAAIGVLGASNPPSPTPTIGAPQSSLVAVAPTSPAMASPTEQAATATAPPKTPSPAPSILAATTDGVVLPASRAALATRHPIAVMIDDQARARPQSGLSQADIVYQAPAEGGIPRYMAIFQTQDPSSIGPIRSSRFYFVGWAAEWRALFAHVGGAPNALAYLRRLDGKRLWNADEQQWAAYMFRISARSAPHNCYTTSAKMRALAARVGAVAPFTDAPWTFAEGTPRTDRPTGGTIVVPYPANRVTYNYDAASNTYLRSVSGEGPQIDAGNRKRVAPSNVVVQYVQVGRLWNSDPDSSNESKGRLEIGYVGSGTATIFENGVSISARWSKATEFAATVFTYASGPQAGQRVPFVRGQIFVQVVPAGTNVTWVAGRG